MSRIRRLIAGFPHSRIRTGQSTYPGLAGLPTLARGVNEAVIHGESFTLALTGSTEEAQFTTH
jgi:hypothetical protein